MNTEQHVEIFDGPDELAAALADMFVDCASTAITERGAFYVALAGGSTPKAAYALLAQEPRINQVSWKDVFIYFGDERCVPPDDEQSNYNMAKRSFLDKINMPMGNVHRMRGEDEPALAAAAYGEILQQDLSPQPRFDLILLGMGPEGHTASLFPGVAVDDSKLVDAPFVDKLHGTRLTLTPHVINDARRVVIATQGAEKAQVFAAVMRGPRNPQLYPISGIAPSDGELTWLVDRAAALDWNA